MMMWGPVLFAILAGCLIFGIALYFCGLTLAQFIKDVWDDVRDLVKDIVKVWTTKK